MLDKQIYRNIQVPSESDLANVKGKYEEVAERVGQFQKTTGGFVGIVMGSSGDDAHAERILKALSALGVPARKHVASAHKTPLYALEKVSRLDGMLGRVVYITIAGRSNALSAFIDAATANCVIACPPIGSNFSGMDILSSLSLPSGIASMVVLEPENAALAAAKILAVDDTVLYGRVLVSQYKNRTNVVDADARAGGSPGQAPPNGKASQN